MSGQLKKDLNLLDVFCIATGTMISSGLFVLPGLAHALAGPAVVLSYLLAGIFAITGMLSQAELVSAMPKTGGTYFYVTRSMGFAAGTVDGLITWFSLSLKSAFALVGMAAFMEMFWAVDIRIISTLCCIFFVGLNIVGIKEAGKIQRVFVLGLLLILVFYVVRGFPSVDMHNFEPFAPNGIAAIFTSAGFVFISFGGLLKIASIAEEVQNPSQTIPLGMIFSLLVVTILYTLVVFVTSGVLGASQLDHSLTPISDGARIFLGSKGVLWLSVAAILAFISTANAGIMAASRYLMAMSCDGLLPSAFGAVNQRFKTPSVAIIVTGFCIAVAVFFELSMLVKMASTVLICTFLFSCLAVIIMRESRLQNYQPRFKAPLYPWVQMIGILGCLLLIFEMGREALIVFCAFILGGLFIYWFYGRIKNTKEYALLHVIERITSKDLTSGLLETELKEIIRERDEITKDRFDGLIEKCDIVDIDEALPLEDFFRLVSNHFAQRVSVSAHIMYPLLLNREKEDSTIIAPGIAIPHIIVDGERCFDIFVARCQKGIYFSKEAPKVDTVFVLVGTKDERNFHLRVLSAIAQVLLNPDFKKKWLLAKNIEGLRDILLLSKRMR